MCLYFTDVGLLSFILGIRKAEQITRDPIVGSIFENLVVLECLKSRYNRGKMSDLYFYRDSNNNEVDIIFQDGRELVAIEIKSSSTYSSEQLKGLRRFNKLTTSVGRSVLVYNGKNITLDNCELINFRNIDRLFSEAEFS